MTPTDGPPVPQDGKRSRWLVVLAAGLLLIPLSMIALRTLSWIRYGVDYPYSDDWRALMDGKLGSFDIAYFFTFENGTLYPFGKFLDWVAHQAFASNAVVYQSLQLVVILGLVLLFQVVLLRRVFRGAPLLVAAIAVLVILGLRAAESYWGSTSLGYHQAIPLVCLLALLVLATGSIGNRASVFVISLVVGTMAGLAYVSGAFAMLAAGIALLITGWFLADGLRSRVLATGAAALVSGAATMVVQLVARASHGPSTPLSMPWELDVWRFVLGILADSLLLPKDQPALSFTVVSLVIILAVGFGVTLLYRTVTRRVDREESVLAVVYLATGAAIGAYLFLVAAGRLDYARAPGMDIDAFVLGWARFYQWWPTILWPWVVAAAVFWLWRRLGGRARPSRILALSAAVAAAAFTVVALRTDAFDFDRHHVWMAREREAIAACVSQHLASDRPVRCQTRRGWDLAGAILYADSIESSFTRIIHPRSLSDGRVDPLFRLSEADASEFVIGEAHVIDLADDGYRITGGRGHSWQIRPSRADALRSCQVLELEAGVRAPTAISTIFKYTILDDAGGSVPRQRSQALRGLDDPDTVSIMALSESGFTSPLTVVPASGAGEYDLVGLTLYCHRSTG